MSKILEAYKLKTGESARPSAEVRRAGSVRLYSGPVGQQQEDFNQLAQRTLALRTEARGTVLFSASTTSGEGASYVSYNLATALALEYNQKVAWVDANFLSPQAALAGPGRATLAEILKEPELAATIVSDSNPYLIAGGPDLVGSKGLVAARNYQDVLMGLANRFDFVIVDLPPVLASSETGMMASGGDGFLLVIKQKHLKWEIVEHGVNLLRDKGVQVLGTVINRREFVLPKVIYDRL